MHLDNLHYWPEPCGLLKKAISTPCIGREWHSLDYRGFLDVVGFALRDPHLPGDGILIELHIQADKSIGKLKVLSSQPYFTPIDAYSYDDFEEFIGTKISPCSRVEVICTAYGDLWIPD